jgi:hypothetical protein
MSQVNDYRINCSSLFVLELRGHRFNQPLHVFTCLESYIPRVDTFLPKSKSIKFGLAWINRNHGRPGAQDAAALGKRQR